MNIISLDHNSSPRLINVIAEENNLKAELEYLRNKDSEARKKADKKLKGEVASGPVTLIVHWY